MEKADKIYQELVDLTKYITEKRKLGWLLLDENSEVITAEFVYETPFDDNCISFKYGKTTWGSIIAYGKTDNFGESTFLKECYSARKMLKKYKLFEPKKIHKL